MSGKIRRNFSHHELSVATATGYIRSIDRFYRPKIRGYPIDDHDPERATDRDDAVYAEAIPGGYLLHVTIADVAAHIPKDSSLDKAALSRAFTIYRPPARDPMFPFVLSEDRFSLEHEQERLGVTATIELDQGFQPVDIRFSRTVITSECHDYATASRRMGMEGDDFELLARIAKGVKETYRPPIHPYGSSDTAYMDKTGLLRRGEAGAMAAAKLVQVMMIFANNEIAKFFTRTGLPFLYRNHAHDGENQGRAEYEPYDRGHYALRSEGLRGAYSHCTSPIRRYADLVNQRMMHYCMDVASSIAGELAGFFPEEERRTKHSLQPLVWEHLEGILADNFKVQQAFGRARMEAEKQLQLKLKAVLRDVFPNAKDALYQQGDPVAQLVSAVVRLPVPYSHEELSAITPSLNSAHVEEREAITELNR
ncbi:MAG: RNB domain-containing ribonuclease, partial [Rickettsiales bacterium]